MKYLICALLFFSMQSHAYEPVSVDRLAEAIVLYKDDPAVQKCIAQAKAGNKYAYYAVLYIAESELLLSDRMRLHEKLTPLMKAGDNKKVYQELKRNSSKEYARRFKEVSIMLPKAIKYCQGL